MGLGGKTQTENSAPQHDGGNHDASQRDERLRAPHRNLTGKMKFGAARKSQNGLREKDCQHQSRQRASRNLRSDRRKRQCSQTQAQNGKASCPPSHRRLRHTRHNAQQRTQCQRSQGQPGRFVCVPDHETYAFGDRCGRESPYLLVLLMPV